jgi:chemotaxis protein CheZ
MPPAEGAECLAEARAQMLAMAELLSATRAEIAALAPPRGPVGIGDASDTLDLVVAETEQAAFAIMRNAELAQAAAERLIGQGTPEQAQEAAEVKHAATEIVLACVFQDITGQRIRKVIGALQEIEQRVARLTGLLGIAPEEAAPPPPREGDAILLNGPSSPAQGGLAQGAVDDLFD